MNNILKKVSILGVIMTLSGFMMAATASDKSVTVFPAEGNKQCSNFSLNVIRQINGVISPTTGTISDGTKSASYAISAGGTVMSFSNATAPIDYVLLKNSGNVSFIIYPSGGVTSDGNMKLTVGSVDFPITAYSLCYGLGNVVAPPPPPPPLKTLKSCSSGGGGGSFLDGTGITCPASGRTLVCNVELDKPFYGLNDGTDTCCVCNNANNAGLAECNPNAPAGEPNACPKATAATNPVEVTTHIELNNDPYYCTTIGGSRTCFRY